MPMVLAIPTARASLNLAAGRGQALLIDVYLSRQRHPTVSVAAAMVRRA